MVISMQTNKHSFNIKAALAEIKAGQEQADKQSRFWFAGEIAEQIRNVPIGSKLFIRRKRVMLRMAKIGLPVYQPWLTQLLRWHAHKGGAIKTDVLALKYQLLDDSMRRDLAWDKALDDHIEALAISAYQEHKGKPRE